TPNEQPEPNAPAVRFSATIARHLSAEGASIVVNYLTDKEGADKVVDEIVTAARTLRWAQTFQPRVGSLRCSRK
ncbi:MAG: hypothetical protein WBY98_21935, partial [Candidatus Sulfotelmatobacter sp.]